MEFIYENDYESWSYEPTYEEVEKAKKDMVLDTIKWKISNTMGQTKFDESDIMKFKIIAELIVGGHFEDINDEDAMYIDLKDYFYNRARNIQDIQTLYEIEDLEYKIAKGMM